jgi:hypothetical protein
MAMAVNRRGLSKSMYDSMSETKYAAVHGQHRCESVMCLALLGHVVEALTPAQG